MGKRPAWVDENGYMKPGAPGTDAPPKGLSRAEHIAYRRPVTEARHARQEAASQALLDSSAPDGSEGASTFIGLDVPTVTSDTSSVDPVTGETLMGWIRKNPETNRFEANPNYAKWKAQRAIQDRSHPISPQFSGVY